jgi:MFS family permease
MLLVATASQLIILLVIQALLGSMITPAWTALIGDLVPHHKLGRVNANINLWATIGALVATLVSGVVMIAVGGSLHEMFLVPVVVAAITGMASSLMIIRIREKRSNYQKLGFSKHFVSDVLGLDVLTRARRTPQLVKYIYVECTFQFFMSISWPLFAITQISILNASMLQIALLSVVQSFVTILFQGWAGRLADTRGRKPLLFFFRLSLVTVPIAYALSPNMNTLIVVSTFWGFSQALGSASATAYLLDVSPEEYRGSFIALFNLILGVITFFGSLIGGYLSDYVIGIYGTLMGLQIVYLISTVGRTIGAASYLTLKETLKKP